MLQRLGRLENRLFEFLGRYQIAIEIQTGKKVEHKGSIGAWKNWKPGDLYLELLLRGYIPSDDRYAIFLGLANIGRKITDENMLTDETITVGEILSKLRREHPYLPFIPKMVLRKEYS